MGGSAGVISEFDKSDVGFRGMAMSDDNIAEIFAVLGPVTIRRMFSGKGVYVDGVIVAIEYGDELRLKADPKSAPDFAAAGATQWTYDGHRGEVLMPYTNSH